MSCEIFILLCTWCILFCHLPSAYPHAVNICKHFLLQTIRKLLKSMRQNSIFSKKLTIRVHPTYIPHTSCKQTKMFATHTWEVHKMFTANVRCKPFSAVREKSLSFLNDINKRNFKNIPYF